MVFIKDWIAERKENKLTNQEIADEMGVQPSMVSKYTQIHRIPSIHVAKNIFLLGGVVIHPYSAESLVYEIGRD